VPRTGLRATEVSACVGQSVTLPCYSMKRMGVDWIHENNNYQYVVASGFVQNNYKNRFSLNQTATHQHSLVISELQVSDQGVYVCVEDAGLGPRHPYRLTGQRLSFRSRYRSTQPCIRPGSLTRVPASAGGKGCYVTSAGWQVCSHMAREFQ